MQMQKFLLFWCALAILVLVELVPTFSPGLNVPGSHCYNTCQCTAAVAAMPLVVKLLLLGDGIVGQKKENRQTQTDRQILGTPALWNVVNLPLLVVCAVYASRHREGERQ